MRLRNAVGLSIWVTSFGLGCVQVGLPQASVQPANLTFSFEIANRSTFSARDPVDAEEMRFSGGMTRFAKDQLIIDANEEEISSLAKAFKLRVLEQEVIPIMEFGGGVKVPIPSLSRGSSSLGSILVTS